MVGAAGLTGAAGVSSVRAGMSPARAGTRPAPTDGAAGMSSVGAGFMPAQGAEGMAAGHGHASRLTHDRPGWPGRSITRATGSIRWSY